ncbi:uncharacterized protein [Coffea arabica]|uniref:Endonuclease/exonuclease/phosphatase domain-containing protein n=1 Tax=Coffea arabica TaxID=13443 RepID=A0ABM4X733_COFAR
MVYMDTRIICWNCRGAVNSRFWRNLKEIIRDNDPMILVLVETRTSSDKGARILRRFNFNQMAFVEAQGFSGGIWMFWNDREVEVEVVSTNWQIVNTVVKNRDGKEWLMSAIYASPEKELQKLLWKYLQELGEKVKFPWLLLGDFNEVVDSTEKRGGRRFVGEYSNSLIECIQICELIDLGFSGPALTWNNCREGGANVRKRLDRVLCNGMWNLDYQKASVTHLTRTHSDHHPIRVNTKRDDGQRGCSPFRVENAWFTHQDFYNQVDQSWNNNVDLLENVKIFTEKIGNWNREVFGNILRRKKRCQARINGIQRSLSRQPSTHLLGLEKKLIAEYNTILEQEEIMWHQGRRWNG